MSSISDEKFSYLRDLNEEIWLTRDYLRQVSRKLTGEEWKNLEKLIAQHELACVMGSPLGFTLEMTLWASPSYPGLEPTALLRLSNEHLEDILIPAGEGFFRRSYGFFSRFTHNKRNKEILAHSGLPEPEDMSYYEY